METLGKSKPSVTSEGTADAYQYQQLKQQLAAEEAAGSQINAKNINVPQKATDILKYIQEKNSPPPYYKGGSVYKNSPPAEELPEGGAFYEYDVNPKVFGQPRGPERIIIDTNTGKAWYTDDHYETFTPLN